MRELRDNIISSVSGLSTSPVYELRREDNPEEFKLVFTDSDSGVVFCKLKQILAVCLMPSVMALSFM